MQERVPLIRVEMLYKDYEQEERALQKIMYQNRIPAQESETLENEFNKDDLFNVLEARKRKIKAIEKDLARVLNTPYTKEEAEHVIRNEVTHLILTNTTL